MAEVVEHPPQPRGVPAARVVVGDDGVVGADAEGAESGREDLRVGQRMAARCAEPGRVGQVGVHVQVDRAGDVASVVRRAAGSGLPQRPAHVDDAQPRVVEMRLERADGPEGHGEEYAARCGVGCADRAPVRCERC